MIITSIRQVVEGRDPATVPPAISVREACHVLNRHDIGAVAVVEDDRLVGILSERDVLRKCIGGNRRTDETSVAEIMTASPVTIEADASLADAFRIMSEGRFRHLPVTDKGRMIAMLSIRDIPTQYRMMYERYAESFSALAAQ
jgi:CBS domain-containing protein